LATIVVAGRSFGSAVAVGESVKHPLDGVFARGAVLTAPFLVGRASRDDPVPRACLR
jgi:hypothetical protein